MTSKSELGLVQMWWGDGKGKTTAALGMAVRALGRGFRVHLIQFLKGGIKGVEAFEEYGELKALKRLRTSRLNVTGCPNGSSANPPKGTLRPGARH
jgi:cob(I)alamin adenosyltransferase